MRTATAALLSAPRIVGPADHRLQRRNDGSANGNRVNGEMRLCAVPALALDLDAELVSAHHRRAVPRLDHAGRSPLRNMQTEDGIDVRVLEHAGLGQLKGGLRAGEAAADDGHGTHEEALAVVARAARLRCSPVG